MDAADGWCALPDAWFVHRMRIGVRAPNNARETGRVTRCAGTRSQSKHTTTHVALLLFVWGLLLLIRDLETPLQPPNQIHCVHKWHAASCLCRCPRPFMRLSAPPYTMTDIWPTLPHTPVPGNAPVLESTTNAFSRAMYPFIRPCVVVHC